MLSLSSELKKKPREKTRIQMQEIEEKGTRLQTVTLYVVGLANNNVLHRSNPAVGDELLHCEYYTLIIQFVFTLLTLFQTCLFFSFLFMLLLFYK
jgi:hypothetical protein